MWKKRKFLYVIMVIALFVLAAVYVLGSKKNNVDVPNPRAVETIVVQDQTLRPGGGLAGIVMPLREAKLGFQVGGRLQGPMLEEGTSVQEGMVLAALDPADYQVQAEAAGAVTEAARAGVEQARAVLEQAGAAKQKAQQDYNRAKSLFESGAVSRAQYDDAETQLLVVSAKYREAQAAYNDGQGASVADYQKARALANQSQLQLSHTELKAPFKGTILKKLAESGEMVSSGYPVYVIGELDQIKVEVTIAAGELKDWQAGDPVKVTSPDLPGRNWQGAVSLIHPSVDQETGTFLMEVSVENPDHALKPGMVASMAGLRQTRPAVWIPLGAMIKRGAEVTVFVVRDEKSVAKKITTGETAGNQIEVTAGLEPGEELVVRGALYLHNGDPVLRQKT